MLDALASPAATREPEATPRSTSPSHATQCVGQEPIAAPDAQPTGTGSNASSTTPSTAS